jgi:hypothetical protein
MHSKVHNVGGYVHTAKVRKRRTAVAVYFMLVGTLVGLTTPQFSGGTMLAILFLLVGAAIAIEANWRG